LRWLVIVSSAALGRAFSVNLAIAASISPEPFIGPRHRLGLSIELGIEGPEPLIDRGGGRDHYGDRQIVIDKDTGLSR